LKLSVTSLLLKVTAWALGRNPMLNSRLEGDKIYLLPEMHLGIAVAIESGLIVPVIKNVERKTATQLESELEDLVERARQGRLKPEDVAGGTFTISNLGMYGVDRFTAIINPPQMGILAVGRTRRFFAPDADDRPVAHIMMTFRRGVDHRVVDGAVAARFLADLREAMEHPQLMVL
jgi:pyruvate dehydrogenase E2 component (dihydrolipoamide acetyltransferase)